MSSGRPERRTIPMTGSGSGIASDIASDHAARMDPASIVIERHARRTERRSAFRARGPAKHLIFMVVFTAAGAAVVPTASAFEHEGGQLPGRKGSDDIADISAVTREIRLDPGLEEPLERPRAHAAGGQCRDPMRCQQLHRNEASALGVIGGREQRHVDNTAVTERHQGKDVTMTEMH